MVKEIDTSGLSCPQPVLMFLAEVKKDPDGEYDVLVDNDASFENVTRAAKNHGFDVESAQENANLMRLKIRKKKDA